MIPIKFKKITASQHQFTKYEIWKKNYEDIENEFKELEDEFGDNP